MLMPKKSFNHGSMRTPRAAACWSAFPLSKVHGMEQCTGRMARHVRVRYVCVCVERGICGKRQKGQMERERDREELEQR